MGGILKGSITLFLLIFGSYHSYSQSFWVESFGTGCNVGTLADGFSSPQGVWQIDAPAGSNGVDANVWYISAAENGEGVGNCGAGCGTNPTLHIGNQASDGGATYLNSGASNTDTKAISPVIDCSGRCTVELSFEYFENGDGTNDNLIVWYFDGTVWAVLEDSPKTGLGSCAPNGLWDQRRITLPVSAGNNPDVQIGFQWVNNADGTGTNPSAAIYNIQLSSEDNEAPVITCPPNQSQVANAGVCNALINDYTSLITWSDNCTDAADMTFQQTPAPGSIVSGPDNVTMLVTDSAGNSSSCAFQMNIIDNEAPDLTCPSDFNVFTSSSCDFTIPDYSDSVLAVDNCSGIAGLTYTQSPVTGTVLSGLGTVQTITMDVEDEAGNVNTCSFDITLADSTKPTIVCPSTQNVDADANCDYSVTDYTSLATVGDNCSSIANLVTTQDISPGSILNKGIHTIELTVEDESGNTEVCSFDLEVADITAPVIASCAPNQFEPATADCEAVLGDYSGLVSVSDACDLTTDLTITQSPAIGSVFTSLTTVTLTVSDLSGNSTNCTFDVDVLDTISPMADCSADTTVAINTNCEYGAPDVIGLVLGTDNCSSFSNMTLSQNIASGTTLTNAQSIEVTLTDENGNTNTCSVQVNVEDLIPPSLSCLADQTINNGSNCNYQIIDYSSMVTVSDNCGVPTLTQNPAAGTEIGTGTHIVEFIAEDASGNSAICSFVLTVSEFTLPTITCPTDTLTCEPVVSYAAPIVVENCTDYTLTQNDATGYTSGDVFPAGITNQQYEVVDGSGNVASCSFNIEVLENTSNAEIITLSNSFCEETSVVLEATSPASGTGEWSVISGGANLNNQFASTTGSNNLTYGSNTFVWTVSSPACGNESDTIIIEVFQNPSQANTQDNLTLCDDTLINIAATSPLVGTGSWSDVNGTASFLDSMAPNTVLYNLNEGWNEIMWTVSNGNCLSTFDTINVFKKSNAKIFTQDTTVCLLTEDFQLNGSPIPSGVSGIWYVISGGAEFENQASATPTVTDLNGGSNTIVYGQNHPVCGSTTDTLILIGEQCEDYNPIIPTVITPNTDGKNDLFVIKDLHVLYPNADVKIVNRWGNLVYESKGYLEPWDGTLNNEGKELEMGTYFYRILLNDTTDKEITGPISIIR